MSERDEIIRAMALSEEQQAFLTHPPDKSARLLAGPGTGKSYTSVAYLEHVTDKDPNLRVGYITFTRAATAEFAKKMNDAGLMALGGHPPRTMHGFALSILLSHQSGRIPYPLRIPDSWEVKHLIHPDICLLLRNKGYSDVTPGVVGKLEDELAANFQSLNSESLPIAADRPDLVRAYKGVWAQHRQSYRYTLLSELPYQAARVLEDLDQSDLGLDLLIVDEYQDLNRADQLVLERVAARGIAVLAIGDDDQSIYSWRNAAPEGIRTYNDTFNTNFDYPLSVSQRCGGRALEMANNLIEMDPERPVKNRLSPSERAPETDFHYLRFKSNVAEARGVAKIVASRIASGVNPSEVGVLVRSSRDVWVRELQDAFAEADVPIAPVADLSEVLGDRGVRTALAVGQLIRNLQDSLAWRALLKVEPGIGPTAVDYVYGSDTEGSFTSRLLAVQAQGFPNLRPNLRKVLNAVVSATIERASTEVASSPPPAEGGWAAWLADLVGRGLFTSSALELFLVVGEQFGAEDSLGEFVNQFETSLKELLAGAADGVRVITMGASKGLTLNTVVVVGVEACTMPAPWGRWDEELRLLYVAITRATDLTFVTYANTRTGATARLGNQQIGRQREQSPFMAELEGASIENADAYLEELD
jgi:DNA helicase-2/ATP-dependent DNA helicase PcrA